MTGLPPDVWASVTGLALWDTLNFPVMLILIFILGRPRPLIHGAAFTIGMFASHVLGGLAFIQGAAPQVAEGLAYLAPYAPALLAGLGAIFIAIGWMMPATPSPPPAVPLLRDHSAAGWFMIGILVTLTKLPIAAAYALAMTQVVQASPEPFWEAAGLIYYNVIAFLPVFLIWAMALIWQRTSQRYLGELNELIRAYGTRVTKWAFVLIGLGLVVNYVFEVLG